MTLRDTLSSSQIYSLFKRCGVVIEIGHLKALLKELGFNFNGPACSLTILLQACKAYLNGIRGGYATASQGNLRSQQTQSEYSGLQGLVRANEGTVNTRERRKKLIGVIRDIFYSSKQNLYEIFKLGMAGSQMDAEGFQRIMGAYGGGQLDESEVDFVFQGLRQNRNGRVTFQSFEETFRSEMPTAAEMESVVVRKVREWMFMNRLSSEMAWDTICRAAGRFVDRTLTRPQFHQGMLHNAVGLSAVQIDALFSMLTPDVTATLDFKMWQSRIFEDGDNPLQMIREIVDEHRLTQEDLLFQMKLRVWDDDLDRAAFYKTLRNLD